MAGAVEAFVARLLEKGRPKQSDSDDFREEMKGLLLPEESRAKFFEVFAAETALSSGDSLGVLFKYCVFPGLESLDDDVQLAAVLVLDQCVRDALPTELRWYAVPLYEFLLIALTVRDNQKLLAAAMKVAFETSEKLENKRTLRPDFFRFMERLLEYATHATEGASLTYGATMAPFVTSMGIHTTKYLSSMLPWLLGLVSKGVLMGGYIAGNDREIDQKWDMKLGCVRTLKAALTSCWPCLSEPEYEKTKENIIAAICRGALATRSTKVVGRDEAPPSPGQQAVWKEYIAVAKLVKGLSPLGWYEATIEDHIIAPLLARKVSDDSSFVTTLRLVQSLQEAFPRED
jgi:hypothetical protein